MQVGEIRPATVDDFKQLLDIVFSHDGWEAKPNKGGVKVWTKSISTSPVKMIKLAVDFDDISALTLYDVLHDPNFRAVWDESMIEGLDVYKIDDFNDIGYYSLRCPPPLKNRDFVNQRSWGVFGDDHMIMNHTIDIEEMPVKKEFVRGVSYLTGYVVRKSDTGCSVYYITQNDPGGQVPKWLLNRISSVIAPKVLEKIHKAALIYEDWKSKNGPDWRPWRGIGQDDKPLWPKSYQNQTCKASNSTPTLETLKSTEPDNSTPTLIAHNGTTEPESLPQYGSLDSLAQQHSETPRPDTASSAEEIISNVINVAEQTPPDEAPTRPPLVRHESITIRCSNEPAPDAEGARNSPVGGRGRHNEQNRRSLLATFDYPHQQSDCRRPGLQHANSLDRPTQPISSSMDHHTSPELSILPVTFDTGVSGSGMLGQGSGMLGQGSGMLEYSAGMTRGMQRTDSLDTGSQISDLCYSISQLTQGNHGIGGPENFRPRPPRPGSAASSRVAAPPGSFASVTVSSHPIDPDCGTRVSRHVMGTYGGSSRMTTPRFTPTSVRSKPHKLQVDTIPERAEYRVKKSSKEPEGLESSSLKFFSRMSQEKTQHRKKKKQGASKTKQAAGEGSRQTVDRQQVYNSRQGDRQRTESR